VQAELITFADGGLVDYKIAEGLRRYEGAVANGVTSSSYGSWSGSFIFPAVPPDAVNRTADPASWSEKALGRGEPGTRFTLVCSPNGTPGSVWGTGPYTGDSSVCTAGVHSGGITVADGGTVNVVLVPGLEAYEGTTANGITTSSWGTFASSFTIDVAG